MSRKVLVPLVLPADPTAAMEAVTKQYVDARAGNEVFIGPTDPIATYPEVEVWYDTDAIAGGAVWTALTPLTPFINLGSYWAPLSYRKIDDVVSIRGVLYTSAVVNAGTLIASLPAGVFPPTGTSVITAQAMVLSASQTTPSLCRIDVRTNVSGLWWGLPTTTSTLAHVGINISYSVTA